MRETKLVKSCVVTKQIARKKSKVILNSRRDESEEDKAKRRRLNEEAQLDDTQPFHENLVSPPSAAPTPYEVH